MQVCDVPNSDVCECKSHPLLGGLVAEVQGSGVPVHSNISIPNTGSVLCAVYCTASTEPGNIRMELQYIHSLRHRNLEPIN